METTVKTIDNEKREFELTFQLSKTEIFEVCYHTIGGNKHPYFSTSGAIFNRPKTDFNRCGQCQEAFKSFTTAYNFYKKWDFMQTKDITMEQYNEMASDIEGLKTKYNWIDSANFSAQRELSKQQPKRKAN